MASATSFPCPVCREIIQPVDQNESIENWAQQFPTNILVQELIQLQETLPESLYCKPCQSKGSMFTPAEVWCKTMNAGFCKTCKFEFHDVIHGECSTLDDVGSSTTGNQSQETSSVKCVRHSENMDYYCEDDKVLGCNKCMFIDHERCKEVKTVAEYHRKLKNDSKLEDMKTSLLKSTEVLQSLVKDFGEQLEIMMQSHDIALKYIRDLREKIDRRLDELQKDITDDLASSFKEEKRKIEASLQQCERLVTGMEHTLKSSATAVDEDDGLETILSFQRGQEKLTSCIDLVTEMRKSFTSVSIAHEIDPSLVTLDNNTKLTLGKISVRKEPRRFPDCPDHLDIPLPERGAMEVGRFNIKSRTDRLNCSSRGVIYLQDGHIVVADYNNRKLKLFSDGGRYINELTVLGCPRDMCQVDKNTVAVAIASPGGVFVVKVRPSKLSMLSEIYLPTGKHCYGVTYVDGRFVVSTGEEVYSLEMDGAAEKLHEYDAASFCLASDPNQRRILVSLHTDTAGGHGVAVSGLAVDKHHTDLLKVGVVRGAWGLDVNEGYVYVCGHSSRNC